MTTCMFYEGTAISVSIKFKICVSFLIKEIATLTPTSASGGMTYCPVSHGRS